MEEISGAINNPLVVMAKLVKPDSLFFDFNKPSSHKQIITLFNPANKEVLFSVYTTHPDNFSISTSKNSIAAQSTFDM